MADSEPLLRELGVSLKTPFDWAGQPQITMKKTDNDSAQAGDLPLSNVLGAASQTLSKPVSGLDALMDYAHKVSLDGRSSGGKEDKVKDVLRSLFADAGVPLSSSGKKQQENAFPEKTEPKKDKSKKLCNVLLKGDVTSRDVSIRGLSDRAVAELTVESRNSLFGSILRIFDSGDAANYGDANKDIIGNASIGGGSDVGDVIAKAQPILTTAEIVRSVHLSASPGDIPPGMDSKEYSMAAIHFLSSNVPMISEEDVVGRRRDFESKEGLDLLRETLPLLPLLKAINPEESLEKRSWGRVRPLVDPWGDGDRGAGSIRKRKEFPDSMDSDIDFRRKVLNLERIFASSLPFSSSSFPPHSNNGSNEFDSSNLSYIFQRYVSRRKMCPKIEGGVKEELSLMISGHLQQQNQPPISSAHTPQTSSKPSSTTLTPRITLHPKVGGKGVPSSTSAPHAHAHGGVLSNKSKSGTGGEIKAHPAHHPKIHLSISNKKAHAGPIKRKADGEDRGKPSMPKKKKKKKVVDEKEWLGF